MIIRRQCRKILLLGRFCSCRGFMSLSNPFWNPVILNRKVKLRIKKPSGKKEGPGSNTNVVAKKRGTQKHPCDQSSRMTASTIYEYFFCTKSFLVEDEIISKIYFFLFSPWHSKFCFIKRHL